MVILTIGRYLKREKNRKNINRLTDREIAIKKWKNGKNLLVGDTKIIMEILGLKYGNSADMKTFRELEEKQIEKMQK